MYTDGIPDKTDLVASWIIHESRRTQSRLSSALARAERRMRTSLRYVCQTTSMTIVSDSLILR